MVQTAKDAHAEAASKHYVVYTPRPGLHIAFAVPKGKSNADIHQQIADYENNKQSKRTYTCVVVAGSFNMSRVDATDADSAIAKAKRLGLAHETIPVVITRHMRLLREQEKIDRDALTRQRAGSPHDELLDRIFGSPRGRRESPFDDLFEGIFSRRP